GDRNRPLRGVDVDLDPLRERGRGPGDEREEENRPAPHCVPPGGLSRSANSPARGGAGRGSDLRSARSPVLPQKPSPDDSASSMLVMWPPASMSTLKMGLVFPSQTEAPDQFAWTLTWTRALHGEMSGSKAPAPGAIAAAVSVASAAGAGAGALAASCSSTRWVIFASSSSAEGGGCVLGGAGLGFCRGAGSLGITISFTAGFRAGAGA